jgi:hypothetical protein
MTDAFQILFIRWIVLNVRVDFFVHVHCPVFISISLPVVSNILDYHSWKNYCFTVRNFFLFLFSFNEWVCICLHRFLLLGWWVTITFPFVEYIDGKLLTACVVLPFSRPVCSCTFCKKLCATVRRLSHSTLESVSAVFHNIGKTYSVPSAVFVILLFVVIRK